MTISALPTFTAFSTILLKTLKLNTKMFSHRTFPIKSQQHQGIHHSWASVNMKELAHKNSITKQKRPPLWATQNGLLLCHRTMGTLGGSSTLGKGGLHGDTVQRGAGVMVLIFFLVWCHEVLGESNYGGVYFSFCIRFLVRNVTLLSKITIKFKLFKIRGIRHKLKKINKIMIFSTIRLAQTVSNQPLCYDASRVQSPHRICMVEICMVYRYRITCMFINPWYWIY